MSSIRRPNTGLESKGVARPPDTAPTSSVRTPRPPLKLSDAMKELAPRVHVRPPATTRKKPNPSKENRPPTHTTDGRNIEHSSIEHSSIDIDAFLSEEEDNILDSAFTLSTPNSQDEIRSKNPSSIPMETDVDAADRLLSLRRDYKKTSVSFAKANSHLNFVSSCQTTKKTPKGLRVGIRCSAFLADQTNVQQQFSETTTKAEHGYVHHLNTHYENVIVQLKSSPSGHNVHYTSPGDSRGKKKTPCHVGEDRHQYQQTLERFREKKAEKTLNYLHAQPKTPPY